MGLANCVIHWYVWLDIVNGDRQFLAAPRFKNLTTSRFIHPIDSLDKVARSFNTIISNLEPSRPCVTPVCVYIYIRVQLFGQTLYFNLIVIIIAKVVVYRFLINRRVIIINKQTEKELPFVPAISRLV